MQKLVYTTIAGAMLTAASATAGEVAGPIAGPTASIPTLPSGLTLKANGGAHSAFIWRGLNLGSGLVDAGLDASYNYAGLELSAGAHAYQTSYNTAAFDNRVDFYAQAAKDLGFAKALVGYKYYFFDNTVADTQEVYFGLQKDFGPISTSLIHYWDMDGALTDQYTELNLGYTANQLYGLETNLQVGYAVENNGFTHAALTVGKTFKAGPGLSLTPYIGYSVELDALQSYANNGHLATRAGGNEFFGGVKFNYSF